MTVETYIFDQSSRKTDERSLAHALQSAFCECKEALQLTQVHPLVLDDRVQRETLRRLLPIEVQVH
jgi:hypothetical protein